MDLSESCRERPLWFPSLGLVPACAGTDMKSVSIAPVVQAWAEKDVEALIWDRAQGHRGSAYDGIAVQRIEQPPYSPELNHVIPAQAGTGGTRL